MALNDGVVHSTEATLADDPAAEINKPQWNSAHIINKVMHITPGTTEPAAPATGWVEFTIDSGTTPNRRIFKGVKLSTGEVIPIYEAYV